MVPIVMYQMFQAKCPALCLKYMGAHTTPVANNTTVGEKKSPANDSLRTDSRCFSSEAVRDRALDLAAKMREKPEENWNFEEGTEEKERSRNMAGSIFAEGDSLDACDWSAPYPLPVPAGSLHFAAG